MSLRAKMIAVAEKAAAEAVMNERCRCLWCIDQVLIELRKKLDQKLLSTIQLEAAKMKYRIAEAVAVELRRAIVSGVRPSGPGTADLSPTE